ncbi:MAG: glycosyltransferase family 1 protein [Calditrichia bacterium]
MKVVYFADSLPPIADGVSHTMCRLADSLLANNVQFQMISPFQPGENYRWNSRVIKIPSVRFPLYRQYRLGLPQISRIAQFVRAFQPDIIHAVSPTFMGVYAQKLAMSMNVPVVASFHTHFSSYFRYYRAGAFEKLAEKTLARFYNRCDATFAPSENIIEMLKNQGVQSLKLWTRGIDINRFTPAKYDVDLRLSIDAGTKPVLLFVGRLVKEKDLDDLIKMAKILEQRNLPHKLVIVGDGPMRKELRLKLKNAVFAGHQSGEALAKWFASADIFVFPSTTETFGNVILEAFASGLPVVAANAGGPASLVKTGINGYLAKPNSPVDLCLCVEKLLDNRPLRIKMGMNARSFAEQFSWDAVNRQLLTDYQQIIENYHFSHSRVFVSERNSGKHLAPVFQKKWLATNFNQK